MRWHLLLILAIASISSPFSAANTADNNHLQKILSAKLVRVCIWPDYYSISFFDPKTQQLSGIDIDLANELGKDLGVAVKFIDSSFAKLIDDVSKDRCDIAMFGVGITPAREKKLRFSQPYLASDIYAVTSKSNRRITQWNDIDQPGKVVAVAKGTLHEAIMKTKLHNAKLLILNSPFAREQAVQSGRADVFMTDYPYSKRFLARTDWARLIVSPATYHITGYGYAMRPGDDMWYNRIERFISDIKQDGRLMKSAKKFSLEAILVK